MMTVPTNDPRPRINQRPIVPIEAMGRVSPASRNVAMKTGKNARLYSHNAAIRHSAPKKAARYLGLVKYSGRVVATNRRTSAPEAIAATAIILGVRSFTASSGCFQHADNSSAPFTWRVFDYAIFAVDAHHGKLVCLAGEGAHGRRQGLHILGRHDSAIPILGHQICPATRGFAQDHGQ